MIAAVDKPVQTSLLSISKEELAYIAGIIDGEGSIGFCNQGKGMGRRSFFPRLDITNTDKRLMDWLSSRLVRSSLWSGPGKTERWNARYNFRVNRKLELESILSAVLPFLVIKRQQAELVLEFLSLQVDLRRSSKVHRDIHNGQLSGHIPTPYTKRETEIIEEVYRLNLRGPKRYQKP